jgi:hypothetical protein
MKNEQPRPAMIVMRWRSSILHFAFYTLHLNVVPAGNAPASPGYQPGALLLSYGTVTNRGFAPKRFTGRNTKFSFTLGRKRTSPVGL